MNLRWVVINHKSTSCLFFFFYPVEKSRSTCCNCSELHSVSFKGCNIFPLKISLYHTRMLQKVTLPLKSLTFPFLKIFMKKILIPLTNSRGHRSNRATKNVTMLFQILDKIKLESGWDLPKTAKFRVLLSSKSRIFSSYVLKYFPDITSFVMTPS